MTTRQGPYKAINSTLDARDIGHALRSAMPLSASDDYMDRLVALADRLVSNCQEVPRSPSTWL